jgi:exonuclease III
MDNMFKYEIEPVNPDILLLQEYQKGDQKTVERLQAMGYKVKGGLTKGAC